MLAVVLSTAAVSFILTLAVPVVTALVTKAEAPDRVKAVVTIILAAVVVLITQAVDDSGAAVLSGATFLAWLQTTAIAVASYLGFYKPVLDVNSRLLPGVGIGKPSPE